MTALIASSIALIGISALALAFGWLGARSELIWISIVASVASAVCLSLAYYRSRAEARRPAPVLPPDPVRVRPAPPAAGEETSPNLFGPDSGLE